MFCSSTGVPHLKESAPLLHPAVELCSGPRGGALSHEREAPARRIQKQEPFVKPAQDPRVVPMGGGYSQVEVTLRIQ